MNTKLFIFLITFLPILVVAQETQIKGVILDKETSEPIPFAHIAAGEVVNISNIDGDFVISVEETLLDKVNLEISYMGYDKFERLLNEFSTTGIDTIYIAPTVIAEEEEDVLVTGISIMEGVFEKLADNYETGHQHMIGYYRETMHVGLKARYIAEGIMDVYIPGNEYNLSPLSQPLRTRKKVFAKSIKKKDLLEGNASDMARSSIWRAGSFLNEGNRNNYTYNFVERTNRGDQKIYIVEFKPKNSVGNTRGTFYIDPETMAIIKIEYKPITDQRFWKSVTWVEEYENRNGIYEMVRVSYSGVKVDNNAKYEALLVANESRPIATLPRKEDMMDANDSFFKKASDDFSDNFWDGYNFIKLDSNIEELFADNSQGI